MVGGEGSRKQRASVTVAYIGELRQLTKVLASVPGMGTSIQMGIENLTQLISVTELSCAFALVGGGEERWECREDLT